MKSLEEDVAALLGAGADDVVAVQPWRDMVNRHLADGLEKQRKKLEGEHEVALQAAEQSADDEGEEVRAQLNQLQADYKKLLEQGGKNRDEVWKFQGRMEGLKMALELVLDHHAKGEGCQFP
tara:strand:+ start:6874 stop:7239 length:366 start_codon:yes stop_codon:yes gene_type:complete